MVLAVGFPLPATAQQAPALRWRVLDSASVESWDGMGEIRVRHITIRYAAKSADVRGVIEPLPLVVGDSELVGLRQDLRSGWRQSFRWRASSSRLEVFALPSDVWVFSFDLAVAPSGRFLAYVAQRGRSAHMHATVRTWPQGKLLFRGPPLPSCDCDVDMNHARWVSPDSFEIAVAGLQGRYLRMSGNAAARRTWLDTLPSEPKWHQ